MKRLIQCAVCLVTLNLVILPQRTIAHEWNIDNQRIEAEVVDFNGSHVLFRTKTNRRITVPVSELNSSDLAHLKDIIELYSMAEAQRERLRTQQYREADMQVKVAEYQKTWTNKWAIQFVAPNGRPFYRIYTAPNSLLATNLARADFPYARIVFVKKMARKY